MVDLGDDVIIHVDWADYRLIMIDLGLNVQVHVDYAERCLVINDLESPRGPRR